MSLTRIFNFQLIRMRRNSFSARPKMAVLPSRETRRCVYPYNICERKLPFIFSSPKWAGLSMFTWDASCPRWRESF